MPVGVLLHGHNNRAVFALKRREGDMIKNQESLHYDSHNYAPLPPLLFKREALLVVMSGVVLPTLLL